MDYNRRLTIVLSMLRGLYRYLDGTPASRYVDYAIFNLKACRQLLSLKSYNIKYKKIV